MLALIGAIFDTHSFVKRLTAAVMPIEQAEVLAEEQAKLIDERLVTRQYLDLRLAELKADMLKWMLSIAAGQAALIVTLVKLLP